MSTTLLDSEALWVVSVLCPVEQVAGPEDLVGLDRAEVCLVRRGCFDYRDQRGRVLVDPTTCVFGEPEQQATISHPVPGGDLDTLVFLSPSFLASIGGGTVEVPMTAHVDARTQVVHQRVLTAAVAGADPMTIEELTVDLIARLLASVEPTRVASGRPSTARAQRRLVDDTRTLLVMEPDGLSVVDLAARVGCSPHHLSRVFRRLTGRTISQYRTELRVTHALDRLGDQDHGASSLAQIAAETGFADHAHLTRTIRRTVGTTPHVLRAALETSARRW